MKIQLISLVLIFYSSCLFSQNCEDECLASFINLNTGFNDQTLTVLNTSDFDPKWELVGVPLNDNSGLSLPRPAFVIPNSWGTNNAQSQWISGRPTGTYGVDNCRANLNGDCNRCPVDGCDQGSFKFSYQFCVCAENADILISLNNIMADNNCVIRLVSDDGATNIPLFDHLNIGPAPDGNLNTTRNWDNTAESVFQNVNLSQGTYSIEVDLYNESGITMGFKLIGSLSSEENVFSNDNCCKSKYIIGRKYSDNNCDGVLDGGDSELPDWTFNLSPTSTGTNQSVVSDIDGLFIFSNIEDGDYTINETLLPGWTPSNPTGGTTSLSVSNIYTPSLLFLNCISDEPPMETNCCDSLDNQVNNGDFESGPEGFQTEYERETDISVSSILPGSFGVINSQQASEICENWMVDDHTSFCDTEGNFLVVNGQTGQAGSTVFWQQTLDVEPGEYKLCASFKHLEQCCFDVTPTIDIIINDRVLETVVVDQTDGTDPCSWQEYTFSFEVTGAAITIQFALDETALGDGNDLAVDDIIIGKLPPVPFDLSVRRQSPLTSVYKASINDIEPIATADDLLPDSCEYEWFIAKIETISIDPITGDATPNTYFPGTQLIGGPGNPAAWGLTTEFEGYDINMAGSPPPFISSNFSAGTPGVFDNGLYAVSLTVKNCDCYADATVGRVMGPFTLNRLGNLNTDEIKLSKDALKELEVLKENYRNGTISSNSLFGEAEPNGIGKPTKATLAQNEPNPFDNSTSISYFLPDGSQSAMLRITGIDGSVVEAMPLPVISKGQVRIDAKQYWEGIYFYSLVVDGRVVETKRMVLTR